MPKIQEFIKQNLLFLLKISTLGIGIIYMLYKIEASTSSIDFLSFHISTSEISNVILVLVVFTTFNWFGELQKWKVLTKLHSSLEIAKQVFISHALSIFTPNKFGEYGGKCLFYSKDKSHNIIALTGVGHYCQLSATLFFGGIGFMHLQRISVFDVKQSSLWSIGIMILGLVILLSFKWVRKHLTFIIDNLKQVKPQTFLKTQLWSIFRYLMFSHQFVLLLWAFGAYLTYFDAISIIFLIYFLSSIVPSFALSDVFVKGSIAITLFSMFGVQSNIVLLVVFLMWVFNTMWPALLGYILLMQWKPTFQLIKK